MRVLVTNDDGVESPGLVALAAGDPPDVVASGVNLGPNTGDSILPKLAAAQHRGAGDSMTAAIAIGLAGDDPWEDV
jgi:broad specificity polyphosphatase/5'/3'-nucleotidase SurE